MHVHQPCQIRPPFVLGKQHTHGAASASKCVGGAAGAWLELQLKGAGDSTASARCAIPIDPIGAPTVFRPENRKVTFIERRVARALVATIDVATLPI